MLYVWLMGMMIEILSWTVIIVGIMAEILIFVPWIFR